MNYKLLNLVAAMFAIFLIACSSENQADQAKSPPNVIFFLVDDLGWTDVGTFGSSFYETPHIDQFATEGVKFTNA